jgi:hypothetical protein
MIRPSVLLFALLISAPALYRYAVDQLDITAVLIRFLIAVPVAAILMAALRFVTAGYGKIEEEPAATMIKASPLDTPQEAGPGLPS